MPSATSSASEGCGRDEMAARGCSSGWHAPKHAPKTRLGLTRAAPHSTSGSCARRAIASAEAACCRSAKKAQSAPTTSRSGSAAPSKGHASGAHAASCAACARTFSMGGGCSSPSAGQSSRGGAHSRLRLGLGVGVR
eukprot:scaffold10936_cov33-Phaeocystis_antarctica.AAC.2